MKFPPPNGYSMTHVYVAAALETLPVGLLLCVAMALRLLLAPGRLCAYDAFLFTFAAYAGWRAHASYLWWLWEATEFNERHFPRATHDRQEP